jgi:hypothetical protein
VDCGTSALLTFHVEEEAMTPPDTWKISFVCLASNSTISESVKTSETTGISDAIVMIALCGKSYIIDSR